MATSRLRRLLPFLAWPRADRESLLRDLVAGITVSLLAVPQSMAYAQLAGVPAYYGLYAAFIPTIVAALFGSSHLLSTGPVAMTSLLTAASVSHIAPPGSTQFVTYVTLLALLSGLIQIGLGLAKVAAAFCHSMPVSGSFFEEAILKLERENPALELILVVAGGINQIDASGIEMLRELVKRLRECGITLAVSGAKQQFMDVAERTGLLAEIGSENFFRSDGLAVAALLARLQVQAGV